MGSCSNLHITLITIFLYFHLLSPQLTLSLDIIKVLTDSQNFNIFASMLDASGVVEEFNNDEGGAGITIFAPNDDSFANLPQSKTLQSLPADKKDLVLKFHAIHSYYSQGTLKSVVKQVQPTLATEATGDGSFTLNISQQNESVAINTGIGQGSVVLQTIYDQSPVAIFTVSEVLLPKEIFGNNPIVSTETVD